MANKTGMMEIALCGGLVKANAKTGMVDLRDIEKIGMMLAGIGKAENYGKRVTLWIELKDTKEFLLELGRKYATEEMFSKDLIVQEGSRNFKLWADLLIALKYAMYVNKQLEVEVLDTFINKKILDFRMLGIDYHKELNLKIDALPDRIGKGNKYMYITTATMINERVKGEFKKGWDSEENDPIVTENRTKLINNLIFMMDNGFITNCDELKDQILNCKIR
ncbi:MAG: KilA-N domain-containing protein [Fusobacteriaceae bacterium]